MEPKLLNQNKTAPSSYQSSQQEVCVFYQRVGACRHGNKCVRLHIKPKRSKTVLFLKLYENPSLSNSTYIQHLKTNSDSGSPVKLENNNNKNINSNNTNSASESIVPASLPKLSSLEKKIPDNELQQQVDHLYQDLFTELALKYGEVDKIAICENANQHLGGNVYVKFKDERSAAKCYQDCNDRWYNKRPIFCQLSPVSSFDDAICRQYLITGACERGSSCNFMHLRNPSKRLEGILYSSQRAHVRKLLEE